MAFSVTRKSGCLVSPSEPTPVETLYLSIIDRVAGLRHLVRSLHVFKHGDKPAETIKEALSRALLKYYPFAGRFVDSEHGDVRVACTGEGVWFVNAEADCSLEDVNYFDQYPLMIPQDELLPEPSKEIEPINLPLMMQVTEFTCGGFLVGLVAVHTIADGLGAAQFINAISELARGFEKPTVEPIWSRELIPNPPKLPLGPPPTFYTFKLQYFTMDISPDHINAIKAQYFESMGQQWCSTFDISVAKAWQARTRAIRLDPNEEVHVCFFANTRQLLHQVMPSEGGYYGNCFYPMTVTATSERVTTAELIDIVKIIRDAKAKLPEEFAKWAVGNFMKDPYELSFTYNSLFVSEWTRLGFYEVDYGWGPPVNVVPFSYTDFMAVAVIGAPPAPKKGTRIMTQCVEKEHMQAFQNEMKAFS